MAASAESSETFIQLESFVRGYHAYMDIWNPAIGEELQLKREPENTRDGCVVAVVKPDSCVVGHVPRLLSPIIFHFLARSCNKGVVESWCWVWTGNSLRISHLWSIQVSREAAKTFK